jgi:hypothetical protein
VIQMAQMFVLRVVVRGSRPQWVQRYERGGIRCTFDKDAAKQMGKLSAEELLAKLQVGRSRFTGVIEAAGGQS